MPAPLIQIDNLDRFYQTGPTRTYVLRRIDRKIQEGDFITVMGPSGSGKSTLLNIVGMLDGGWTGEYFRRIIPYTNSTASSAWS